MTALRAIKSDCGTYTVRPGDTLSAIASAFHATVADIVRTNRLGGMRIVIGQQLVIPGYPCQTFGGMQDVPTSPTPAPLPLPPPGYRWVLQFGRYVLRPLPPPIIQPSWDTTDRRGMQDLIPPGSDVPQTTVNPGAQVKVQLRCSGSNDGTANQRIGDYLRNLGYTVMGVDTSAAGSIFSGVVSIVVSSPAFTTLWTVAGNVTNAVRAIGFAISPGSITASVYGGGGSPVNTILPSVGSGIPLTAVNPGDQVKVQLQLSSSAYGTFGASAASRIANLLGNTYRVLGVDSGGTFGGLGGYISVVVQATQPTTLAYIAADVNRAVSTDYSVSQVPGSISAQFYSRAAVNSPAPTPGVNPDAVTNNQPPPPGTPSLFDEIANSIGLSTGLPLTGAVVAGIVVIGVLVFLKT